MEERTCTKCGAETGYSGDLHCRSILIGKVKKLLSLGRGAEAKDLIIYSPGDENWEKWKEETFDRIYFEHKQQIERARFEEEERLREERRVKMLEMLAPSLSLLNDGNFLEADRSI